MSSKYISVSCLLFFGSLVAVAQAASPRWEPQIATLCEPGQQYHPQHLSEDGRWTTDLSIKTPATTCLRDKMDLLEHCKKVYPGRDITNIVESSHYQKIGGWCRQGAMNSAKCKGAQRWVKPFRCLEGPFQSDALLVPEGCLFDHIHNASRCWPFVRWNQTGAAACQERGMQMRSFAMLLPCGISLFSGVEFVCCPKHFKESMKVKKTDLPVMPPEDILPSLDDEADESSMDDDVDDEEADEEDDDMLADEATENDDDYEDDDIDETEQEDEDTWNSLSTPQIKGFKDTGASGTTTTTQKSTEPSSTPAIIDPYYTHFDPRSEH